MYDNCSKVYGILGTDCSMQYNTNGRVFSEECSADGMESIKRIEIRENAPENPTTAILVNTYRFNFGQELTEHIFAFSKIYQYALREDFKEAWSVWKVENDVLIAQEQARLIHDGYVGNIEDKLYNSARYYYRNKGTVKTTPIKRRQYCSIDNELLKAMDQHIHSEIGKGGYKPSSGFDGFCHQSPELVKNTISALLDKHMPKEDIYLKIKKTYKNRYFRIISK